jgi:PAS domain S-box-containing protein
VNKLLENPETADGLGDSLRLELEQCRRELDVCRKRMDQLEGLFAHVVDAIFVAETDGLIIDANPAACALLGYARSELLAMHPWDFVVSASREEILGLIQGVQLGTPVTIQRTYRCKTGEQKLMDLRLTRCDLAGRNLIIVSCRDITEQKHLEDRLRRSEKNLAEGQRLTKTGSWILDFNTGNTDWSVETCRIFGFPDPPPSPHYSEFRARVRPEDRDGVDRGLRESFETGEPRPLKYIFVLPDGVRKYIETISQPVRDEAGAVVRLMGTVMDVTERVKAGEALRRSEDYLRLAIDTIPGLVWSAKSDGYIEYLNKRWIEYTGLTLQEASGWGWQAAVCPEDLPRLLDYWKSILASGQAGEIEARLRRFDGTYRWFLFRGVPLHDESGNLVKWYGTNTDIEDRKWAEALLAGEKRVLEMIANSSPLPALLDALCRVVEELSSGALCSILLLDSKSNRLWHGAAPGLPASYTEAIDGSAIGPATGPCGRAAYFRETMVVSDVATDPLSGEFRDLALAHGLRACWSTPILSSEGSVLGTFAIYFREPRSPVIQHKRITEQITHLAAVAIERKKSEEALRASELLARGQVNALTRTLDALAMESAPDRLVEHVLRTITEQLAAHSSSVWKRDEASGLVGFEFALEDGRLLTKADSHISRISPSLPVQNIWPWPEVFQTGKPSLLEDIRKGPVFPWRDHLLAQGVVSILIVPMLIAGRVDGVIGIRFTQQRTFRAEEMELAQALANQAVLAMQLTRLSLQSRQAAVMAERNRMARDVHDTLAQGFTGVIVQLEAAADATAKGFAAAAGDHLNRAGELARESLREARRSVQALRPQALEENDLCEALESLLKKMTAGTSLRAEFVLNGQSRPRPAEWDENLLRIGQEVLTNALRHAQATYFKAELAFATDEVRLDLRDNGRGFDPESRHDGFGLLGIRERVEGMGGHLAIQSGNGSGTAILIVLPFKTNVESQAP